ncbi:MAG: uncharacterized SAM-binding protein YcdF (DUF218 family) [Paraglaciecola sp.]
MFFYLSKILFFLIKPINWVGFLLLFAIFTKKEKRCKKAVIAAFAMLLFFGNHFIFNLVVNSWEPTAVDMTKIEQPYEIGILLGGYSSMNKRPNQDRHNFNERGNRFFQAYELYKFGKIEKILLTGGNGFILQDLPSEATQIRDFLIKIGVPDSVIIVESVSRTTYENAVYTKKILTESYPDARCLLITSAWHMPRSQGIFQKQGMDFDTFPVDYLSERVKVTPDDFLPNKLGFYYWEMLIKEWVGYCAYWAKGYL